MNKQRFIASLKRRLARLPRREIAERVSFYSEMIDDRMEDGLSEEAAVAAIGPIDTIVMQIMSESAQSTPTKRRSPLERKLTGWEKTVMIIGSPIWGSLLIVAAAVLFSLYAVMWALIVTLWALELPFYIMAFISKYLLVGCTYVTRGAILLTKKSVTALKVRK